MAPEATASIRATGALVFRPVPSLSFDPYRGVVHAPDELFASFDESDESDESYQGYEATPDARMLRAIHDDAISDAPDELLVGKRVMGVVGGHAMARGTAAYTGAARLGRELTRAGFTVATGGGPGWSTGSWRPGSIETSRRLMRGQSKRPLTAYALTVLTQHL